MARTATIDQGSQRERALSNALREAIGSRKHDLWFGSPTTIGFHGATVRVCAATAFASEWIERNYADAIRQCADDVLGATCEVVIEAAPPLRDPAIEAMPETASPTPAVSPMPAECDGSAISPAPRATSRSAACVSGAWRSFGEFIVGDANRLAYESARQMADSDDAALRVLFLHGSCGVGKSHLLQSVCRNFRERRPAARFRYTTGEQFTNEFVAAVRDGSIEAHRKRMRCLDLLVIDDVHFLANKTATQSECLHTIDAIGYLGAKVVLASDAHPREIARMSTPLVSRFLAGMVVEVGEPDLATRRALVQTLAARRGLNLTPAAIDVLVERAGSTAREIEGAILALTAVHAIEGGMEPPTRRLIDRALGSARQAGGSRPVRIADIVAGVCEVTGVEQVDLVGSGRHRRVVTARGLVAHLARELTTLSFPEIATALGRSTHSTVHAAAARFRASVAAGARVEDAHGTVDASELLDRAMRAMQRHRI